MKKNIIMAISCMLLMGVVGCGSEAGSTNSQSTTNTSNTETTTNTTNTETAIEVVSENSSAETIESTSANIINTSVTLNEDSEFSNRDFETGIGYENFGNVELSDGASTSDNQGVVISGDTITITTEGTYKLSGKLSNGQIIVDTDKSEKVQLIFDNVEINNNTSPAVHVVQSDKVFVTLESGSNNVLTANIINEETDSAFYSKEDLTFNGAGSLIVNCTNGTGISSNDDLVFTGGNFDITSDNHGVDANNSIRIADGTFNITASKDAFHCEHKTDESLGYIYIVNGNFTLDVDGDGFDSSSVINIKHGVFDITTGGGMANAPVQVALANNRQMQGGMVQGGQMQGGMARGGQMGEMAQGGQMGEMPQGGQMGEMPQGGQMQGGQMGEMPMGDIDENSPEYQMFLMMTDSSITPEELMAKAEELGIEMPMGNMDRGMQGGGAMDTAQMAQGGQMGEMPQGGQMQEMPMGGMHGEAMDPEQMAQGGQMQEMPMSEIPAEILAEDDENFISRKAIKATKSIILENGTFKIDSYDDAIHSNHEVSIYGGTFEIETADDAIHGDVYTNIYGGDINIIFCFEGIEGQKIVIDGGDIDIYANDDGINAALSNNFDSTDSSLDREISITINGGKIVMDTNSEGDGVDSNGNLYINGGDILISSTTDVRDTSLDFQNSGYITGGIFVATGSASGTIQNFDEGSTQGSIMMRLNQIQTGDVIIEDEFGSIILQFTPVKPYQGLTISIPELEVGKTYTVTTGDEVNIIEMTSLLYGAGGHQSGQQTGRR